MTNCLFFGDSITYGEYDGILSGWVDYLKRFTHAKFYNENAKEVNIYNLGIGGDTSFGLLKRLNTELEARTSAFENVVFLFYGANDLAIKNGETIVPLDQFKKNMISAIGEIKKVTETIFIISIIPISDRIDGVEVASGKLRTNKAIKLYNETLKQITLENNIEFIDIYSEFYENKEKLFSKDGVHPNEVGYKVIANKIKPIIEKYL